jgi:hypothetical protein
MRGICVKGFISEIRAIRDWELGVLGIAGLEGMLGVLVILGTLGIACLLDLLCF